MEHKIEELYLTLMFGRFSFKKVYDFFRFIAFFIFTGKIFILITILKSTVYYIYIQFKTKPINLKV